MIYADIVPRRNEGVVHNVSIVFYGSDLDREFWKERFNVHMAGIEKPSQCDIMNFFANEAWSRAGAASFYRKSADPKKV